LAFPTKLLRRAVAAELRAIKIDFLHGGIGGSQLDGLIWLS
jgi:hypothetical protein